MATTNLFSQSELRKQLEPITYAPTTRISASDQDAYAEVRCYSLSLRH